ncbi:hypothetical protein I540_1395 [Mycobacteroides abscessus subsp. bolletii 1513]|uniref:Uncharacterized protein n=1 Tax=Mycobacteroides abscessus subsp. bolletii 1513 TaxID=1299321 RepID=X8DMR9_9MYCO|nr:hypothetical protein I540_1395 [Mycobacteroides abscessus subsp. bolletii 1513]
MSWFWLSEFWPLEPPSRPEPSALSALSRLPFCLRSPSAGWFWFWLRRRSPRPSRGPRRSRPSSPRSPAWIRSPASAPRQEDRARSGSAQPIPSGSIPSVGPPPVPTRPAAAGSAPPDCCSSVHQARPDAHEWRRSSRPYASQRCPSRLPDWPARAAPEAPSSTARPVRHPGAPYRRGRMRLRRAPPEFPGRLRSR